MANKCKVFRADKVKKKSNIEGVWTSYVPLSALARTTASQGRRGRTYDELAHKGGALRYSRLISVVVWAPRMINLLAGKERCGIVGSSALLYEPNVR